jgi:multiple sugar transport system substrate-binding protein
MARHRLSVTLAGLLCAATLVLSACGTDSGSSGSGGGTTVQVWEGYTGPEAKAFARLLAEYTQQHPGQKVSSLYVNNDDTLPKVLTAVRGGSPPDIAYLYGSWAPNVAQIPQVVNLSTVVRQPGVNWNDFWVGERKVATVNGKVIGVPALVDNLAVVYNKTLFARAGLAPPGPDWTWAQFQADAKKLTIASAKQFGTAYVTPASEDTVWHWEALLWEAGGQLRCATWCCARWPGTRSPGSAFSAGPPCSW